jgi:hypothetical protein
VVITYEELGREQDARAEVAEARRLAPKFSLEEMTRKMRLDREAPATQRYLDDLEKAGLK